MTVPITSTVLTPAGLTRLKAELEDLDGPQRRVIVKKIDEAREEGDLKENGGYHAAREELGKLQGRVAELIQIIRYATVAEVADDSTAGAGKVITMAIGSGEPKQYFLGSKEDAAGDLEILSMLSPMGEAITGRTAGETVSFTTPTGRTIDLTLVAVDPFEG